MKSIKITVAGLLLAGFASSAFAGGYGAAGCGLGSLAFQENDATQILAATTNGTFGSQTFGLTFGTSNCNNRGVIKVSMQRESFIEANYKDLSRDVAAGKGEFVTNLARLYNVTPENTGKFVNLLQKNHTMIFASNNAQNAVNAIDNLVSTI